MAAETARLIASLELQDKNFTRGLKNVEKRVAGVDRRLGAVSGAVNRNVARGIDTLISKGGEFLTGTIKDATEFETAITGVAKTVTGDITGISDELKKMSTEIPLSFVELAGIAELGGAMGIAKADIVAFTEQVAILGTTTDVTVEDAATALGQLQNVVGLTGGEFDNFAASLVDLGNKGASTESQILEIAKRSGAAAKTVGVAKDEFLGWAAAAANLGINAELGGTSLQNFFLKTQTAVTGAGKDFEKLAKISGKTTKDFKKMWAEDATGALTSFLGGLGKLTKGQRIKAIQDIYGKGSGMTRLILGLADSIDSPTGLNAALETNATSWDEATAANEEAQKRFATSESLFKKLDNSVKIVSATVGEALLPVLNDLATEGIAFLNEPKTQKGIKDFAKGLGEGIRGLAAVVTSINWGAVAGFLSTAAGFAGQLVTWFTKMPDWAQAFLIGGFVATKLPVIGSIISELGKGLIKGVLGMTAGVVHLNAGTVIGGGLPGAAGAGAGGAAGAGAGALATAAGVAAPVILIGGAAISLREIAGYAGQNYLLQQQGLSEAEITAQRYFNGTHADQQMIFKRLGRLPTQADFESGNAKLAKAVREGPKREGPKGGAPGAFRPKAPSKEGGAPGAFRPTTEAIRALKNQQTRAAAIASRQSAAQKAELANIKNAQATLNTSITTQTAQQSAELGNIKNATVTGANQQRAALIAQTAVNAAGNMLSVFQSASQVLAAQGTTTAANNTTVAARGAGNQTSLAMSNAASRIVGAVNALDLSVNVTTVNRTSTVNNRYGPGSGSSQGDRTDGGWR